MILVSLGLMNGLISPVRIPSQLLPPKYLKAKIAKVYAFNIHEEEMEPLHVATSKLTNSTNVDQDMKI